jgi:hypothetical protein
MEANNGLGPLSGRRPLSIPTLERELGTQGGSESNFAKTSDFCRFDTLVWIIYRQGSPRRIHNEQDGRIASHFSFLLRHVSHATEFRSRL